jgi:hypothetical protein
MALLSHSKGTLIITLSLPSALVDKPVTASAEVVRELGKFKYLVPHSFQHGWWGSDFLALRRFLPEPPRTPQLLGDLLEFESQQASR